MIKKALIHLFRNNHKVARKAIKIGKIAEANYHYDDWQKEKRDYEKKILDEISRRFDEEEDIN